VHASEGGGAAQVGAHEGVTARGASPSSEYEALTARRLAFQGYPVRRLPRVSYDCVYRVLGAGSRTVLLLPGGGGGRGDGLATLALELARRVKVLSVDYPYRPGLSASKLSRDLAAVLDHAEMPTVTVVGTSLGGMVAQALVRAYPQRVSAALLASTRAPGPDAIPRYSEIIERTRVLPRAEISRLIIESFEKTAATIPSARRGYWEDYFGRYARTVSREERLSEFGLLLDFMGLRYKSADLADWPGQLWIFQPDHDEVLTGPAHSRAPDLRTLYPRAEIRTIPGSGHAVMMTHPEPFISLVNEFLDATA